MKKTINSNKTFSLPLTIPTLKGQQHPVVEIVIAYCNQAKNLPKGKSISFTTVRNKIIKLLITQVAYANKRKDYTSKSWMERKKWLNETLEWVRIKMHLRKELIENWLFLVGNGWDKAFSKKQDT